ncbi:MAG: hypothetical protein LBT60_01200 [Oscillospiraceae bacterium]|nr:hypothetical protein [Oscillospiraceae bacterium]
MDDERIVELFWQRSEDALTACGGKFGAYCRRIADNILRDDGDAEECVNETWLKAWNTIPPARPARLKAFLGKITRNAALDRFEAARAQKRGGGRSGNRAGGTGRSACAGHRRRGGDHPGDQRVPGRPAP